MTAGAFPPPSGETLVAALTVVVVADGRSRTRALRGLLTGPGFSVVADAMTAAAAEAAVVEHRPGAVLIDLDPSVGGIEAIERIMGTRATPVVVCGDLARHSQAALAAGAVDVIGALDALPDSPQYATAVRRHLRVAARARVITHPRNRLRSRALAATGPVADPTGTVPTGADPTGADPTGTDPTGTDRAGTDPAAPDLPVAGPAAADTGVAGPVTAAAELARRRPNRWPSSPRGLRLVAIGTSTGGPPALATILADLPPDFPVPVLVVQHMADGFVEGLASWLDGIAALPVVMAEHGRRLAPGVVHVAPAGSNTLVRAGLRVELAPPDPGQFHVPGVDATFTSVAATCGRQAVGVLLTGMGRDGAAGLRALREHGAVTVGQDEPTSVVWGMPAAAQALGAVELELPLPAIGPALVRLLREHGGAVDGSGRVGSGPGSRG